MYSILLVFLSICLTIFSILYLNLNSSEITGFVPYTYLQADPISTEPVVEPAQTPPRPPATQEVINQIDEIALKVSQNTQETSSISQIVESTVLSEQELMQYREELEIMGLQSANSFFSVLGIASAYAPSEPIQEDLTAIVKDIGEISKVMQKIDEILSKTAQGRQELQKNKAEWMITRDGTITNSIDDLFKYSNKVIPIPKEEPEENEVLQSPTDILNIIRETDPACSYPSTLAAFNNELVDFGDSGINSETGEVCKFQKNVVFDVSSGSFNLKSYTLPDLNIPEEVKPILQEKSIKAFNFEAKSPISLSPGGKEEYENTGVVIYKDDNELLNIKFFSSLDYQNIEKRMSEFVYSLFFEDKDSSKTITAMSIEQADSIINEKNSVPWLIWGILAIMILIFIFSENIFIQSHKTIIAQGKKALQNKNYQMALDIYNELIRKYSQNEQAKQEILDYLTILKKETGNNKIEISKNSQKGFPKINEKFVPNKTMRDYNRVEKMIYDALDEIKNNPKLASTRMPIIASEYNKLTNKERENLAQIYERLVYELKDSR